MGPILVLFLYSGNVLGEYLILQNVNAQDFNQILSIITI